MASTTAVALVLTRFLPLTGAIFLVVAASIAIGAFLGRYHYFLDVVTGRDRGSDCFSGLSVGISTVALRPQPRH